MTPKRGPHKPLVDQQPVIHFISRCTLFRGAVNGMHSHSITQMNEKRFLNEFSSALKDLENCNLFTCSQSCQILIFYETMFISTQLPNEWGKEEDPRVVHWMCSLNSLSTWLLSGFQRLQNFSVVMRFCRLVPLSWELNAIICKE